MTWSVLIRRLLLLDHPAETRFFLFVGGFGLVLGAIYWFLTYELAGTTMLGGFGAGAALLGVGLFRSRPRAFAIAAHRHGTQDQGVRTGDATGPERGIDDGPARGDDRPDGTETPFEDPSGRMPTETLAPLSLGLGVALAITAVVFGPWLLVAGLLPLAWGAWTWLASARDELTATVEDEAPAAAGSAAEPRAADGAPALPSARPARREP